MRPMDELSGAGASRHLPAPSGLRVPTGQVPVELPPGPMHDSEPVLPYLPAAPAKASGPVSGQVAAILVTPPAVSDAAATGVPAESRSRLRIVLVAALVVAIVAAAFLIL